MAQQWIVRAFPIHQEEIVTDTEPFATAVLSDGNPYLLTREEVHTPPDSSKATELIGTLAEMPTPADG